MPWLACPEQRGEILLLGWLVDTMETAEAREPYVVLNRREGKAGRKRIRWDEERREKNRLEEETEQEFQDRLKKLQQDNLLNTSIIPGEPMPPEFR